MKLVFDSYQPRESIPVHDYIRNRKMAKYFNRETSAALVSVGKLLRGSNLSPETPIYYETGILEFEDLGLPTIIAASLDDQQAFSQKRYIEQGIKAVPPLTQFKALYNMPVCFISIEYGLTGDNAVIYSSARGLLFQAVNAPSDGSCILLGCGKVHDNGKVESAFAMATKEELRGYPPEAQSGEAIDMFREWNNV